MTADSASRKNTGITDRLYRASSRFLWEVRARQIDRRYGAHLADVAELERVLARLHPRSVLEVGCGAGRLMALYERAGVARVVGVDISRRALALARRRYPRYSFVRASAVEFPRFEERFDLAVAFRALQHVAPGGIEQALDGVTALTDSIFLEEQRAGRGHLYLFIHDYDALLGARGFDRAPLTGADTDATLYVRRSSSSTNSST